MIKRPKKVARSEKQIFTSEQYQQYAEEQFNVIYDYLDGKQEGSDVQNFKIKSLDQKLEANIFLLKSGGVCEFRLHIHIEDPTQVNDAGLFRVINVDSNFIPKRIETTDNYLYTPRTTIYDSQSWDKTNNQYGYVGITEDEGVANIIIVFYNLDRLASEYGSSPANLVAYYTYITK